MQDSKRWIGKLKNQETKFGIMQKVVMDGNKPVNKDGTPNQYFKGTLLWLDANGGAYEVKQMNLQVPRDGMSKSQIDNGFVANITIDLNNKYDVEPYNQ